MLELNVSLDIILNMIYSFSSLIVRRSNAPRLALILKVFQGINN